MNKNAGLDLLAEYLFLSELAQSLLRQGEEALSDRCFEAAGEILAAVLSRRE